MTKPSQPLPATARPEESCFGLFFHLSDGPRFPNPRSVFVVPTPEACNSWTMWTSLHDFARRHFTAAAVSARGITESRTTSTVHVACLEITGNSPHRSLLFSLSQYPSPGEPIYTQAGKRRESGRQKHGQSWQRPVLKKRLTPYLCYAVFGRP